MSSEMSTHKADEIHNNPISDIAPVHDFAVAPSIAVQMAALDSSIAWHYAQIAMLKARRNSFAPICTLPNELLSRIFTIYAVDSNTLFNLKWTKIMLVCRHWHDLARAAQPLWAFIDVGWNQKDIGRMWTQLERSGVSPLTLKIADCDSPMYAHVILENSERLYSLELAGDADRILDFANQLPLHNFPVLRSLSLDPSGMREEISEGTSAEIAESVFNGGMPYLRELSLKWINVPWSSLRGLESLSLARCSNSETSVSPTFDGFLDMLASSPQLTTVKLDRIIPPPVPEQHDRTIDLPNLAHINLRDNVDLCAAFLSHVCFPPTTKIALLPSAISSGADVRQLLIPLRKHVRAAGAPAPALLQIECHGGANGAGILYFLITIRSTTSPPGPLEPGGLLSLNSHPTNENGLRQIMVKVLRALPCEFITHLDARSATRLTITSWKAALRLLPALEMVYLQITVGIAVSTILRALLEIERYAPTERQQYPRVRHIHLLAVMWEREAELIADMLGQLEEFLQLCLAQGTPVRVLEIDEQDRCLQMEEERWERLFGLVGEKMIRNGVVYDPVARREKLVRWRAEMEREQSEEL
ncbi:hypothetical protein FB451DRAFT_1558453 [Mycena latifolia]|nr:hypothetical protein FB451DRAFT_1558453 [Mycena latifolia]